MVTLATRRTRGDMAAAALALREHGLLPREIGDELGISRSYAAELLDDPAGDKVRARKNGYRRPCPDCGALMNGSNGRQAPRLCADCTSAVQHEERHWTKQRVIAAIQLWNELHGRPPVAQDWLQYADRTSWPTVTAVQREFGSWRAAIAAAGFPSRTWHRWSAELVLEAIRNWVALHGDIPRVDDWKRPTDEHPTSTTVVHYFGSWNDAMVAAGFTPRPSGAQPGRHS